MALTPEEKSLLALQDIDIRLAQLNEQLEKAPHKQRVATVRAKLAEGEKRVQIIAQSRAELEERIATLEAEINEFGSRMSAHQTKMQESADHRAVESLSRELESLLKQKEKRENEGINLMEKRSAFGEAQRDTETKMNRLREIETNELISYKEFLQKAHEAKEILLERRESYLADISPEVLTSYEQISAQKGGIGVALYADGKCGGCSVHIPAAQRATIESSEGISTCPTCKRLLIVS